MKLFLFNIVSNNIYSLCNHRLEETFEIIKSNHQPDLLGPIAKLSLSATSTHTLNTSRDGKSTTSWAALSSA